jgi:hypothetical protein
MHDKLDITGGNRSTFELDIGKLLKKEIDCCWSPRDMDVGDSDSDMLG